MTKPYLAYRVFGQKETETKAHHACRANHYIKTYECFSQDPDVQDNY